MTMAVNVGGGGSGGGGDVAACSIGHLNAGTTFTIHIAAAELSVLHFDRVDSIC